MSKLVVLTGNPNSGKTTVFNALTGLRAKVANYPGVTVERKEGPLQGTPPDLRATVLDLPGSYSLSPRSLDEQVARDVLLNHLPEVAPPDVVVLILDAANLERNLYYATQVLELGYPTVLALNMMDVATQIGHHVDPQDLAERLHVPVVPMVASRGEGLPALRRQILQTLRCPPEAAASGVTTQIPAGFEEDIGQLTGALAGSRLVSPVRARAEAMLLLSDDKLVQQHPKVYPESLRQLTGEIRRRLERCGVDWRSAAIESRYARIAAIHAAVDREDPGIQETASDRLDRWVTHRVWGPLLFLGVMALMFESIFTLARWPMEWVEGFFGLLARGVTNWIPPGDLQSLLADGVVAGVGAVVVFLPQILMLFFFIGLLEDTGYMARAAFLMDQVMSKVGLHGRSFIPLLSSFACAVPGIMATRTIESSKDRLATILVAPLMGCSARLPVYTLLIAACIPDRRVLGIFQTQGLTLFGLYLLGALAAMAMAWLFKRTLLRGEPPLLILELPPYKRPVARMVLRHMWERSRIFLYQAGTVILCSTIVLWFLATYPRSQDIADAYSRKRAALELAAPQTTPGSAAATAARAEQLAQLNREQAGENLRQSFAGRLGRALEPVIEPLGFDWKMGIGIIASYAAREVFVSTMSTVYNLGGTEETADGSRILADVLKRQTRPDGRPVYTPRVGLALMVFYVFALQCTSTVAVVRRETNSWRWPLFQWVYLSVLAWVGAWLVYQGGGWLGWA